MKRLSEEDLSAFEAWPDRVEREVRLNLVAEIRALREVEKHVREIMPLTNPLIGRGVSREVAMVRSRIADALQKLPEVTGS